MLGASAGVYIWQHNKVKDLNSQINNLNTKLSSIATTQPLSSSKTVSPTTFVYKPKTGGLSLTLPKSYGVIVNVDGNKGGAAGATFRVASATSSNEFSDTSYQGVQIDIDNLFYSNNLSQAVQAKESELNDQSTATRTYSVTDTTVAGLPAKLIKTNGLDEYQGNLSIYLVGSGSFLYTVTANGTQNDSFPLLDTVLKGMAIKSVSL